MIVFWRLVLAYYICAVLFCNPRFFAWRERHMSAAVLGQGICFASVAALLCASYWHHNWQLAELWVMPGWLGIILCSVIYMVLNSLFVYRPQKTRHHTLTFLVHDTLMLFGLFACSPLHTVYRTGNFMHEPLTVFFVGLLLVTRIFSIFIYMVEMDLYGRDFPTIDESFVTMLMRLIFFLIVLLPGWRWVLWFLVWFYACGEAHQNRLMDISRFALYFSMFGSAAVGFLVRYGWYWV